MNEKTTDRRLAFFVALHLLLIFSAVAWAVQRAQRWEEERQLPPLRQEPLTLTPLYDDPRVVDDEQLRRVLTRLRFPFQGPRTVIGHVDHALRFWGPEAEFADATYLSGAAMRQLLTDHRSFDLLYHGLQEPLLIDDGASVRVRALEGDASSSHVDHTLASLAEVGTPLDFPVVTPLRVTTVRSLLEQSLRDFGLNQVEYEWSTLAYALYLPPSRRFFTSEGQEVTFDRLADRLMREELPRGVCSGNHRLYALVALLRVDEKVRAEGAPLLQAPTRQRITDFLRQSTEAFVRHQHADGFWNDDWPTAAPASSEPTDREGDRLGERLIVTGHVLEWWALASEDLHPERSVVIDAGQWLVRTVDRLTDEEVAQYFSYLSHVGRALSLWRGQLPEQIDLVEGEG